MAHFGLDVGNDRLACSESFLCKLLDGGSQEDWCKIGQWASKECKFCANYSILRVLFFVIEYVLYDTCVFDKLFRHNVILKFGQLTWKMAKYVQRPTHSLTQSLHMFIVPNSKVVNIHTKKIIIPFYSFSGYHSGS